jgi:hypothetical protein
MENTMHTRESLEETFKSDGYPGLKEVGKLFSVQSTGAEGLIKKILVAQNDKPEPTPLDVEVEYCFMETLTEQRRNTEVPYGEDGSYFPAMVPESQVESLRGALDSFCHQWAFGKVEFFAKLQAFRLYQDGVHRDWIGLNELSRRYNLKIPLAARSAAKRLYTAPQKRAYT